VAGVVWLLTWVADAVASTSGFPRLARRRAVKYILGDPGHQAAHAPAVPQTRASDAPGTNRAMLALGAGLLNTCRARTALAPGLSMALTAPPRPAVSTVGCAVAVAGNAALSESAGRARQVPRQEREDRGEEIAAPPLQQTAVGRARRAGIEHGIYGPAGWSTSQLRPCMQNTNNFQTVGAAAGANSCFLSSHVRADCLCAAVGEMYGYELRSRMLSSGKDQ
jgi:hypothetical protein